MKRELQWREATDIELLAMDALDRCSMRMASGGKRFRRDLQYRREAAKREGRPLLITDRMASYLWMLCHTYRRQINDRQVLFMAAQAKSAAADAGM